MSVCLSDFEYSLIIEFLYFFFIILNGLYFFIIGFDLSRYGLKLSDWLFGDDELSDDFFEMIVKIVLFVGWGLDSFEWLGDGGHLLLWIVLNLYKEEVIQSMNR